MLPPINQLTSQPVNQLTTLAVVLARAGSKGLPHKNTLDLLGRPMIEYTLDHALGAKCLTHIALTTDDSAAAAVGRSRDIEVVQRPPELAGDTATVDSAARHAVEQVELRLGQRSDAVVILYGNVPLRPHNLIDRAVAKLVETGCDSVQSVCPVGKMHPYWMKRMADGDKLEHYQPNSIYRRQDLPPVHMLDGGVIAVTREALFTVKEGEPHAFLGMDRRAIITQPGEVVDIDTPEDLEVARALLLKRRGVQPPLRIGDHCIDENQPVYVIAELGVNHDGRLDRALDLTRAAKAAGADAVKLQLFDPRKLLSAEAVFAEYQQGTAADPFEMLDRLQLSVEQMKAVRSLARELGLGFIVTCFSVELVESMRALDVNAVKLASPDAVNLPLIEAVLALDTPLLLSTGTCTLDELWPAMRLMGNLPGAMLHCVSAYPVPAEQANLRRIATLAETFGRPTGYSDHTTCLAAGALAVAHGAVLIEKHLTYDRAAVGPDHAASFDREQFAEYVRLIRMAEQMRGDGRGVQPVEQDVRQVSRQSLCAARDLAAGHVLSRGDVTVRRPGTGIPAAKLQHILGKSLRRAVSANRLLNHEDVEV